MYTNSSSRIAQILDARYGGLSYAFTYDGGGHLARILNYVATGESYTFGYTGPQTLTGPWGTAGLGPAKMLASVQVTGMGAAPNLFAYTSARPSRPQFTTPLGGSMQWVYSDYTYSGLGRKYREVHQRTTSSIDGTLATWNVAFDTEANAHGTATVSDVRAGSQKVWTSGTHGRAVAGLATAYEEGPAGGTALVHKDYTWTQNTAGNVYVGSVATTQNPGANQLQSKSAQTLDVYGNIMQPQVYAYGNLSTPALTYNYTYSATRSSHRSSTRYPAREPRTTRRHELRDRICVPGEYDVAAHARRVGEHEVREHGGGDVRHGRGGAYDDHGAIIVDELAAGSADAGREQ